MCILLCEWSRWSVIPLTNQGVLTARCLTNVIAFFCGQTVSPLLQVLFFPHLYHRVCHIVQNRQVFLLLPCERRQAEQRVRMNPGFEHPLHCDVSHTVILLTRFIDGLTAPWSCSAWHSKHRHMSDKRFIGSIFINQ